MKEKSEVRGEDVKKTTPELGGGPPDMTCRAGITLANRPLWLTRAIGASARWGLLWIRSSSNIEYILGVEQELVRRTEAVAFLTAYVHWDASLG